jgi:hypothetical protein
MKVVLSDPRFGFASPFKAQPVNVHSRFPARQSLHLAFIDCFAVIYLPL